MTPYMSHSLQVLAGIHMPHSLSPRHHQTRVALHGEAPPKPFVENNICLCEMT